MAAQGYAVSFYVSLHEEIKITVTYGLVSPSTTRPAFCLTVTKKGYGKNDDYDVLYDGERISGAAVLDEARRHLSHGLLPLRCVT